LFVHLRVIHLQRNAANTTSPKPPKVSETPTGALLFGEGVNSDAGLSGQIVVNERNFESEGIDPPTDEEVLGALEKEEKPNRTSPVHRIERKNVRIHKERISQSTSAPRVFPLVGLAQVHSVRFKCTVYFDDAHNSEWPVPYTKSDRKSQEVFIDKSRVVPIKDLPQPVPAPILPAGHHFEDDGQTSPSAGSLKDDIQYFPKAPEAAARNEGSKSWSNLVREQARSKAAGTKAAFEEKLSQKLSLTFKKTPLDAALKELSGKAGLNIVIDNQGLAEEGITVEHPMTLEVEGVKVSTALNVILEPLHLDYVVQEEVLKVTSKTRIENAAMVTATYPVADLVIPIPQRITLDLGDKPEKLAPQKANGRAPVADFKELTQLVVSTIHPDSWDEKGGSGSIRSYETTLSLVVRQTPKVHEELRDLLEQLRRLQDLQVSLAIRMIEVDRIENKALAKNLESGRPISLTPDEVEALILSLQENTAAKFQNAPKVTLFNGQTLQVAFRTDDETGFGMEFSSVVSADRRFVRLGVSANSEANPNEPSNTQSLLKDGHSVLVDVTKRDGKTIMKGMKLSLVTPTIIVQEEEEELLRIDPK
jgi:hypothetical protein